MLYLKMVFEDVTKLRDEIILDYPGGILNPTVRAFIRVRKRAIFLSLSPSFLIIVFIV